jgi:hypothetical protein
MIQIYEYVQVLKHLYYQTGCSRSNVLELYSGGARFESQPGHWLSRLRCFVVFPSPSRQMTG